MRYTVHVTFRKDFIEVAGNAIAVGVRARPEKGKANKAVLRKVAGYFKVPVSRVCIVWGRASRRKVIEIFYNAL